MSLLICLICIQFIAHPADAGSTETTDPEARLHKFLFNDSYDKHIRPGLIKNGTKLPITINILFLPYRIIALDGRLETMALQIGLAEMWDDQRLLWDPEEFGNMTSIGVKPDVSWTPRSYFPNLQTMNREDKAEIANVVIYLPEEHSPKAATVQLQTIAIFQERCTFDMTYFPFDQQTCEMCVASSQYGIADLVYAPSCEIRDVFIQGGEWDLLRAKAYESSFAARSMACLSLTVQRRFVYYIVNLLLPTVTICILNTIGLFAGIDADQSELEFATMGQTTLLSLGVMLLTVADQMPRGACVVSLLGIFFLAMIFQTLLASVTAVYLRKWYRAQSDRVTPVVVSGTMKVIKSNNGGCKKQAAKICMIAHLFVILITFGAVIGVGVSKQGRPA